MTAPTPPTAELLEVAVAAAQAAAAELMRRYGRIEGLDTKSSATDPVSDADRAAERVIVETITAARPDDAILGEEGADRAGTSGLRWVVDPLDGTVNYLYQLGNFSASVAVEQVNPDDPDGIGTPLAAAVVDPTRDRTYTAVAGGGAFRNGERLTINDPVPLDRALIATGFGYAADRRAAQGALVAWLLPQIRDIRRLGSAALDLCTLAAGEVDGYYEEGINHWDFAAGALIVREAGGIFEPFTPTGQPSGWVAAGPALYDQLSRLPIPR